MLEENSENFAQVGFDEFENLMKQIGNKMESKAKMYCSYTTWRRDQEP